MTFSNHSLFELLEINLHSMRGLEVRQWPSCDLLV